MNELLTGGIMLLLLVLYLGLGMWIFMGLILVSATALYFVADFSLTRIGFSLQTIVWSSSTRWELAALPMFIWMGELMYRTDISERLFRGLAPLVSMLPGRLLHVNVLGCTLFAAISGSSSATTATVGKITIKNLKERGYSEKLAIGSLAGAGSLGLLIPPSVVLIIFGVVGEVSISKLFMAGVLPGLMTAAFYVIYVMIVSSTGKNAVPPAPKYSWRDRIRGLYDISPIVALVALIMGGLYSGVVSPSEAGAASVAVSLLYILLSGQFSIRLMRESLASTVNISSMLCAIIIAANFLSTAMGYLNVPASIANGIASLELNPYVLILVLALFFTLLGLFLEGVSITVMTLPITLPLVVQAGFDPVWFGVFLVIAVEMATITPPVGFNLFILQGLTDKSLGYVARAAFPFFLIMLLSGVLITIFPEIALWLTRSM
ncbi:TRAP transporter large permease [Bordetella sp. 15P40C-2]|uniref:TRAP transporter large permease n=1 Tax=Bordetella sp. 15P40C-2 TaxID=2572246 RepID=UPI001325A325|nr:TRAP transporter large permease subunit [Bordetella sp. 15P40C-2]MVW72608.1 TRAP transporter large permease subunit [Bordetella sp. 15P40C-2]